MAILRRTACLTGFCAGAVAVGLMVLAPGFVEFPSRIFAGAPRARSLSTGAQVVAADIVDLRRTTPQRPGTVIVSTMVAGLVLVAGAAANASRRQRCCVETEQRIGRSGAVALRAAAVDLSQELGACAPLGFWDPLGLSEFDDPEVVASSFRRRRAVELQHGRVSMLACIGYIVPEFFRWPGYLSPSANLSFEDVPNGFAGLFSVPFLGWTQIIAFIGYLEITNLQGFSKDNTVGNFEGYGAFGLPGGRDIDDPEKRKRSLLAEINNGRLAMMAIMGMFFQNGLTGGAWGDWSLYTDSPLRAGVDLSQELGACAPLGFWDPLGLSEFDDPEVAASSFKRRRAVELQHGRVSMLACIGYIAPEFSRWPGYLSPSANLSFEDVPNGFAGLFSVPFLGWTQIIAFIGYLEITNLQGFSKDNTPGDFDGYGAFGIPGGRGIDDPEKRRKSLLAEINNGRLAMMAIMGMFFQNGLTGSAWGDWSLYTDSPLRAGVDLSQELGACAPLGFWDPLGLSEFDDPEVAASSFKRRRAVELQHGRVSMLACIGYIAPEFSRWPGYLSPSAKLSFEDVPNGFAGLFSVPFLGWTQIIAFIGYLEITNLQSFSKDNTVGDFEGYGAFGIPGGRGIDDPEKRKKSLLAEINNGRLAMMAIMGMFFQNGLTGSAWGDWSLYTDSPLRAGVDLSQELGACAPLGFWDPLGLSEFADPEVASASFKRRRAVELQHGRVSMLACIGYIVPEFVRWPGYLSPSAQLSFEDVPNGFAGLFSVPFLGWTQIIGFIGYLEITNLQGFSKDGTAGDFEGYGAFGFPGGKSIEDLEKRKKSLLAEINNGRLAMMAIMGMFFQNGLTGQAWGDWSLYTDSPLRAGESAAETSSAGWRGVATGLCVGLLVGVAGASAMEEIFNDNLQVPSSLERMIKSKDLKFTPGLQNDPQEKFKAAAEASLSEQRGGGSVARKASDDVAEQAREVAAQKLAEEVATKKAVAAKKAADEAAKEAADAVAAQKTADEAAARKAAGEAAAKRVADAAAAVQSSEENASKKTKTAAAEKPADDAPPVAAAAAAVVVIGAAAAVATSSNGDDSKNSASKRTADEAAGKGADQGGASKPSAAPATETAQPESTGTDSAP